MSVFDLFALKDKVAVVTGGKGGIGKAIALMFAEAGADIVVCDYIADDGELDATAEEVKKLGRRSLAIQADVSQKNQVESMVERVTGEFGRIDILVNNAGISPMTPPIQELEEDAWNAVMDINLKGCYLCCHAVSKGMIERKQGNIINISSIEGIRTVRRASSPYGPSKAGIINLTQGMAWDMGKNNIRVNAIAPGSIKTEMTRIIWDYDSPQFKEILEQQLQERTEIPGDIDSIEELLNQMIKQGAPMGRWAEPSEIASAALFLASDAASFITGHTLVVDGGMLA